MLIDVNKDLDEQGKKYRRIVIPPRLERGTYSLEGCCSIRLSYGTGKNNLGMQS